MDNDRVRIESLEGSEQIRNFCWEMAKKLALEHESVFWTTDLIEPHQKYILTIIAKTGSTEIAFRREDIEDYPGGLGAEKTNARIKSELENIL
jgi:hypothetical protein